MLVRGEDSSVGIRNAENSVGDWLEGTKLSGVLQPSGAEHDWSIRLRYDWLRKSA